MIQLCRSIKLFYWDCSHRVSECVIFTKNNARKYIFYCNHKKGTFNFVGWKKLGIYSNLASPCGKKMAKIKLNFFFFYFHELSLCSASKSQIMTKYFFDLKSLEKFAKLLKVWMIHCENVFWFFLPLFFIFTTDDQPTWVNVFLCTN